MPLVYVVAANKTASTEHGAHGATLITIRAGRAEPTACQASDILFSSEDVPHGIFTTLVGQQSNGVDLDIYLFGIVDSGLRFAHVHSNAMKDLKAYEYLEPASCSFASASPRPANDNLSSIYLADNFISGAIFYNPFLKTFLLVNFNDKANLTLYIRYLDLETVVCPGKLRVKGGKYGKGL
jgi:hypothetical protein